MTFNAEIASIEMTELAYKYLPQQQSKKDSNRKKIASQKESWQSFLRKTKLKIKKSNKGNEICF